MQTNAKDQQQPLPKVEIPTELSEDVRRYSGILRQPTAQELREDDRLARIWEK